VVHHHMHIASYLILREWFEHQKRKAFVSWFCGKKKCYWYNKLSFTIKQAKDKKMYSIW